ncbi:M48 family metallopeptidase [Neisseria sp. CCUG12390]|uniref:M48 family metallopeptidase n=1 Tax=Neisseria sp. CCUG12390 TaxID=3392035 RepID=UPI003A0FDDB9
MPRFAHTLSDGLEIAIDLKRSAKKNLILRPIDSRCVSINVPPFLSAARLQKWLSENEALLHRTLAKTPVRPTSDLAEKPEWIWYHGFQTALTDAPQTAITLRPSEILVPQKSWPQQQTHLRRFLHERAAEYLLPRLARHAEAMDMPPAATALSNAKTFWGVCRHRTGIRLNWRLVGAPEFVADYVCVHELCHLPHPDHSTKFWALVNRHTPHTEAAKVWLKAHGRELFVLG